MLRTGHVVHVTAGLFTAQAPFLDVRERALGDRDQPEPFQLVRSPREQISASSPIARLHREALGARARGGGLATELRGGHPPVSTARAEPGLLQVPRLDDGRH